MTQDIKMTALVVGGTSGIGKATVDLLLEQGAVVHIVGRNVATVSDKPNLFKHQADITRREDIADLKEMIKGLDSLDYLVNASGIFAQSFSGSQYRGL